MDTTTLILHDASQLVARAGATAADPTRPPIYKVVGICLAIASGLFIGVSFVLKKVGLLKANEKYNEEAGEGYGYLKNAYWWGGMTLMILGEVCNFVAYAFVDAILVTPLGALSVVVTTILSAIFLKERLSFVGKVGCFNCIIGSVVIVLNAPEQSAVADIQEMKRFVLQPGFLSYAGVVIVGSIFIALWAGPRYGKKSMMVYLSICSLVGGLSVVATQGLGSAVVAQAGGKAQFNQWFLYVLLVFVVATLLTEIIYLNKALNLFNAALVTPTYYVFFTSATIVTSAVLFQGFKGTAISITTVIMGFLQICAGVVLLQLSKSAKDVPDAAIFKGDLDQVREVAEQEQPETEPKADAIRGAAAIIRRLSSARQNMEQREFRRLHEEKSIDQLEPLRENEVVEWDGLRRRKTIIGDSSTPASPIIRRKTIHPPLGMSSFPNEDEHDETRSEGNHSGIFDAIRDRASTMLHLPGHRHSDHPQQSPMHPVALTNIEVRPSKTDSPGLPYETNYNEEAEEHIFGLPPGLRKNSRDKRGLLTPRSKPLPPQPEGSPAPVLAPPQSARRQFSFSNFMHRSSRTPANDGNDDVPPHSRAGITSRGSSYSHEQKKALKNATEEERLGLVKGDSSRALLDSSPERPTLYPIRSKAHSPSHSNSSSLSSVDGYHRRPRGRDRSMSNSDDDWQMTDHPNNTSDTRSMSNPIGSGATVTVTGRPRPTPRSSSTNYPAPNTMTRETISNRERQTSPLSYNHLTTLPPLVHEPLQLSAWSHPSQHVAEKRPVHNHPSVSHQTSPTEYTGRPLTTRGQELEQASVRQVVDHTDHFQSSSMNPYQYQSTTLPSRRELSGPGTETTNIQTHDEEITRRYDDSIHDEDHHSQSLYRGEGWGEDLEAESPSQQYISKDKFKEQSQREREKRRQRMSTGVKDPRSIV